MGSKPTFLLAKMTNPMAPDSIPPALRDELASIAREETCELLEIEHRAGVLRFVIDHPDGIRVEHTRQLESDPTP